MFDEYEPGCVTIAGKPKAVQVRPGVWHIQFKFNVRSPWRRDADAIGDACCDDLKRLRQGWNRKRWNR